jgi:hypothetical protein
MAMFFRNTLYIEPTFTKFGTVTLIYAKIFNMEFDGKSYQSLSGQIMAQNKSTSYLTLPEFATNTCRKMP